MECSLTFNENTKQIVISSQTECEWSCIVESGNITLNNYYGKLDRTNSYSANTTIFTYNTHSMEGNVICCFQNDKCIVKKNILIGPTTLHMFYVNNKNFILFGENTKAYIYVYYGTLDKSNYSVLDKVQIINNGEIWEYDGKFQSKDITFGDVLLYNITFQSYNEMLKCFEIIITSKCDLVYHDEVIIKGKNNDGEVIEYKTTISQSIIENAPTLLKIQPNFLFLDSNNPKQKVNVISLFKGAATEYEIQTTNPLNKSNTYNLLQNNLNTEEYLNSTSITPYYNENLDLISLVKDYNASHFVLDMSSCKENDENIGEVAYELYVVNKKDKTKFSKLEFFYDYIFDPENFIEIVSAFNVYAYTYKDGEDVKIKEAENNVINFKEFLSSVQTSLTLYFTKKKEEETWLKSKGLDILFAEYKDNNNIRFTIKSIPNWWKILTVSDNVREVKQNNDLLISLENEIDNSVTDYVTLQNRLGKTCTIYLKSDENIFQQNEYTFSFKKENEYTHFDTIVPYNTSNGALSGKNTNYTFLISKSIEDEIYYFDEEIPIIGNEEMIELQTLVYEKDKENNIINKEIISHSFKIFLNQDIGKKYINYGSITKKNNGDLIENEEKDTNKIYIENKKIIVPIPYKSKTVPWNIINNESNVMFNIYYKNKDNDIILLNDKKPTFFNEKLEEGILIKCIKSYDFINEDKNITIDKDVIYLIPNFVNNSNLNEKTTLIFQQVNTLKELYLYIQLSNNQSTNIINKYGNEPNLRKMYNLSVNGKSSFPNIQESEIKVYGKKEGNMYYASFIKENSFSIKENENINFYIIKSGEKVKKTEGFDNLTISSNNENKLYYYQSNVKIEYDVFNKVKENGEEIKGENIDWKIENGFLKIISGETKTNIFPEKGIIEYFDNNNSMKLNGFVIMKNIISENNDTYDYYAIEYDSFTSFNLNGINYDILKDDDKEYIKISSLYAITDKTVEFDNDVKKYPLDIDNSFYDIKTNVKLYSYLENGEWFLNLPSVDYSIEYDKKPYIIMQGSKKYLKSNLHYLYNDVYYTPKFQVNLSGLTLNLLFNIDGDFEFNNINDILLSESEKEFFIIINNKKYYVTEKEDDEYVIKLEKDYEIEVSSNIILFDKDYFIDLLYEPQHKYVVINGEEINLIDEILIYESESYAPITYVNNQYIIINNKGYLVQKREEEYYFILNYKKYIYPVSSYSSNKIPVLMSFENANNNYFNVTELTNEKLKFELDFNDLFSNNIIHGTISGDSISNGSSYTLTNGYIKTNNNNNNNIFKSIEKYVWIDNNQETIKVVSEEIIKLTYEDILGNAYSLTPIKITFLDKTEIIDEYFENSIIYEPNSANSAETFSSNTTFTINDYSEIKFENDTFITLKNECNISYKIDENDNEIEKDILIRKNETLFIKAGESIIFKDVVKIKLYVGKEIDLFVFNDVIFVDQEVYISSIINNQNAIIYNNNVYYIYDDAVKIDNKIYGINQKIVFVKKINNGVKYEKFNVNFFDNNGTFVKYGYINSKNEVCPLDDIRKKKILWEISLPSFNTTLKRYEINKYNLKDVKTYNISENIIYSTAKIENHDNCGNVNVENGIFTLNIDSYLIESGNTTYNTSKKGNYEFTHSNIINSIWDYSTNDYVKRIYFYSGETIELELKKTLTLQNVKYNVDVNKYVLINNEYYDIYKLAKIDLKNLTYENGETKQKLNHYYISETGNKFTAYTYTIKKITDEQYEIKPKYEYVRKVPLESFSGTTMIINTSFLYHFDGKSSYKKDGNGYGVIYNENLYNIIDGQVTIPQKCFLTEINTGLESNKYMVQFSIDSYLTHNMNIKFINNKIENINYLTVSNALSIPHREEIMIEVENVNIINNKTVPYLYGRYVINFLKE